MTRCLPDLSPLLQFTFTDVPMKHDDFVGAVEQATQRERQATRKGARRRVEEDVLTYERVSACRSDSS